MKNNKALTLLATLGIGANVFANAPILEVNQAVQQIRHLASENKREELLQAVKNLTASLNTLNNLVAENLNRVDLTGFYLLDSLNEWLKFVFKLTTEQFSEEEAFTTYYNVLRPFSNEVRALDVTHTIIKDRLGLIKRQDINTLDDAEKAQLKAFYNALNEWDQQYVS